MVVGGGWCLVIGDWWRLAVVGDWWLGGASSWRLADGGSCSQSKLYTHSPLGEPHVLTDLQSF